MFQFPGFAFLSLYIQPKNTWFTSLLATPKGSNNKVSGGLPHSEIHGSKLILSSPWLIAEYHVFHRLLLPRHPPNALFALDLIQKKSDFFCGSSLLYKKGPINQKCIHCIDGRWFSFRQRSNEITLIPVSVLDLNKIDFQGLIRSHAEPSSYLANP